MGVRLSNLYLSPMGPRFSNIIIPRLTYDRSLLVMQRELFSVVRAHSDPNIARHLAGIVREVYENISVDIICTALVETGYGGKGELPLVQLIFGLGTEGQRIARFEKCVFSIFSTVMSI